MHLILCFIHLAFASELDDCVFTDHFVSSSITLSNYPPSHNTRPSFTIQGKFTESYFIHALESSITRDNGATWTRSTSSISQTYPAGQTVQLSQSLPFQNPSTSQSPSYSKFAIHGSSSSSSNMRVLWCFRMQLPNNPYQS